MTKHCACWDLNPQPAQWEKIGEVVSEAEAAAAAPAGGGTLKKVGQNLISHASLCVTEHEMPGLSLK